MVRTMVRLRPLLCGGVMLGLFQGLGAINYNGVLFQFLSTWINVLVSLLFGGNLSSLTDNGNNLFN